MNVRFEGKNGHDADMTRCLLMTQSGHFGGRPWGRHGGAARAFHDGSSVHRARRARVEDEQ